MKGIIILESCDNWFKGFIPSPFLISVRNVNIVLNQIIFLKMSGCNQIRILKDSLSYQCLETDLGDGSKWGVDISYGVIQKIARQDISSFYNEFIGTDMAIIVKGLFFFSLGSISKNKYNQITIIDEESELFQDERIDSFRKYYEINMDLHKDDIHRFDYAKTKSGPYLGNNIEQEELSIISIDSYIGHKTLVEDNAFVGEGTIVGNSCQIGGDSTLKKTIVLDNVLISKGMKFVECIVGSDYIYDYKGDNVLIINDKHLLNSKKEVTVSSIDRWICTILCLFLFVPYWISSLLKKYTSNDYSFFIATFKQLSRIKVGEMEIVGVLEEDLKLLDEDSLQVPPAIISICNNNEDLLIKKIHLRYYLGTRYNTSRLKTLLLALKRHS